MKIADLKGLGPATTERLEGVDIGTAERLEVIGAVGAYQLLQRAYPGWVSLNALWGMQAALMEIDWRELSTEIKEQLLDELAELIFRSEESNCWCVFPDDRYYSGPSISRSICRRTILISS
ncbi:MAG TPA: hypothetical protein EYQ61_00270 [Dehalococcoidia bacterium]|jgi:hypothetical protein|nr:hypothetical protein [Dehalococcoidia bacterium]HIK90226.1 hypothetical protein [Dehalococcoidia bacterium]